MRCLRLASVITLLSLLASCNPVRFVRYPDALVPKLEIPKQAPRFALVLGGGGSRGLAHIGVLEELEAANLKPDIIIGCSAGAIVGALYAARPDIKWLKELLLQQRMSNFFDLDFSDLPFGLSSNYLLRNFLGDHLSVKTFEELRVPFMSVATNLQTGLLTPMFTGPLIPAILASSAFPGAYKPVEMYGTFYVDGGVADPVPVDTARQLKARVVVAVEIGQKYPAYPPTNFFDVMWRSLNINYTALSQKNAHEADIVMDVPLVGIGMFSDSQNFEIYTLGRITAAKAIPSIRKLLQRKR